MKEKLYSILPHFIQNIMVVLYNLKEYKIRYSSAYLNYREEKNKNKNLSLQELKSYQSKRFKEFVEFSINNSPYYKNTLGDIENSSDIQNINKLPILNKEIFRQNIDTIVVQTNEKLIKAKTGGTTGKSLEVRNFPRNIQERFAFLDHFRSGFGYELGKRTAWFSGKNLLTLHDIKKRRFWKTDFLHHVRYYSTFHIKEDFLKYYVEDLIKYKPEYLVGFPTTILEIARYGLTNGYDFPLDNLKAIFTTSETVTPEMRNKIELFFKTKLYNQYASSEGAPFIFECNKNKLHLELQSGVFEVLDDNNVPTKTGRLVVTSFTNEGTPLIRYDIGDRITLEEESVSCNCGNKNPLVRELLGRIDDYIFSPENGKINLVNIANTLKDTKGIIKFQVIQNELNVIDIFIVKDAKVYSQKIENKFIQNWRDRIGNQMELKIHYTDNILIENSGKYRIVKNNIKHLINE